MERINLDSINKRITDRTNSWYWQIGRDISLVEAMVIWTDKHMGINTNELLALINKNIRIKVDEICEIDVNSQENLGFVNSVRKGRLINGKEVIIRCHPKGIKNGYFYVESLAAKLAIKYGLPGYETYWIHELENTDDIAFQVIEKLPGTAIKKWLETNPQDVDKIMITAGKMLARLHDIKVEGFGPFDNEKAKERKLIGIHDSFAKSVRAGLESSLATLVESQVITQEQSEVLYELYDENSPLLQCEQGIMIHKDFVDWNLLTDGKEVTGMIDWDECASGDPVADIASWCSMSPVSRVEKFLEGYFSIKPKTVMFDEKLQLFILRCNIDNMALRMQRSEYIQSDHLNELIALGKEQLENSFEYFDIDNQKKHK